MAAMRGSGKRGPYGQLTTFAVLVMAASGCQAENGETLELDRVPTRQAVLDLRVGAIDDPVYSLTDITAMLVDDDGSIYTLHRQSPQIRRWTAEGIAAGDIGRVGQGPGEFTRPISMGWHGQSIWVLDLGNYRISLFDMAGTLQETINPRLNLGTRELAEQGINPPRPVGLLSDGSIHGTPPAFSSDLVRGLLTRLPHLRMDEGGTVHDTLAVVPVGKANVLGVEWEQGGIYSSQPFSDAMEAQVMPDGSGMVLLERTVAITPGPAEFRVSRVDLFGDTLWSRAFQYLPIPVPRAQVDSVIRETASRMYESVGERVGRTPAQWERLVADATFDPLYFPPVDRYGVGRDGSIWLALNLRDPDRTHWLMLEPGGTPIARVAMPSRFRWMTADESTIWGVERDELDVPYIVRYRLVP